MVRVAYMQDLENFVSELVKVMGIHGMNVSVVYVSLFFNLRGLMKFDGI